MAELMDELSDKVLATAGDQGAASTPPGPVLVQCDDGVFFGAGSTAQTCQDAVARIFASGGHFTGLDYDVFLRHVFGPLPVPIEGPVRLAAGIEPFIPARRALYKSVRIVQGEAHYCFEPVFLDAGAGRPPAVRLSFDEFVADMWAKGIRFGIDADAVRAAIAGGRTLRCVVARRRDPVPGQDARVAEVADTLHRSNAPRELPGGRLDLHSFQNRFPQVAARQRLLRKVPRTAGTTGFELSGIAIAAPAGRDVELVTVAGPGTVIEHADGTDYLVAAVQGFVSVDHRSARVSIGAKIVNRDGVSTRTTGNLQLQGDYEEFGEVQEKRIVEGAGITIHGDVFGRIVSRGGTITLRRNLMGGAAVNADGDIRVGGVAANAVLRTRAGEVHVLRAQNCVIAGTTVHIRHAVNCEIVADTVVIGCATGCAIAARHIAIDIAGPRKQNEMNLFALVPDTARHDAEVADFAARAAAYGRLTQRHTEAIGELRARQDVRGYLALAQRVRQGEVHLTPPQLALFRKMAAKAAPVLQEVGKLTLAARQARSQQVAMGEQALAARRRRDALAGDVRCQVGQLAGETQLRILAVDPYAAPAWHMTSQEVRARLRGAAQQHAPVAGGSAGALAWQPPSGLTP
ncbi:flagellar assembly protein A [Pseudoduganella buxea]|uniref:Flagellar Assembly Protein A N-terminal region domain-containing protein n=2 Tax=Pseudoduganella buxea TaxID=1949069 RepID=A0ABQ1K2X1_9BURK|nr:flagellar assembly protein A [Pseudoduganella buxea]GGB82741.1 hypothetical protein GCM10011572_00830 [Pseudoduganella buxea]